MNWSSPGSCYTFYSQPCMTCCVKKISSMCVTFFADDSCGVQRFGCSRDCWCLDLFLQVSESRASWSQLDPIDNANSRNECFYQHCTVGYIPSAKFIDAFTFTGSFGGCLGHVQIGLVIVLSTSSVTTDVICDITCLGIGNSLSCRFLMLGLAILGNCSSTLSCSSSSMINANTAENASLISEASSRELSRENKKIKSSVLLKNMGPCLTLFFSGA